MPDKAKKRLRTRFLLFSVIVGIAVSLATGLVENSPLVGMVDTTYYGYPFVWVIAKTTTMEIRHVYMLIDAIFWVAVSFLILSLISEFYYREPAYD